MAYVDGAFCARPEHIGMDVGERGTLDVVYLLSGYAARSKTDALVSGSWYRNQLLCSRYRGVFSNVGPINVRRYLDLFETKGYLPKGIYWRLSWITPSVMANCVR